MGFKSELTSDAVCISDILKHTRKIYNSFLKDPPPPPKLYINDLDPFPMYFKIFIVLLCNYAKDQTQKFSKNGLNVLDIEF